jgi:hypothetical protein
MITTIKGHTIPVNTPISVLDEDDYKVGTLEYSNYANPPKYTWYYCPLTSESTSLSMANSQEIVDYLETRFGTFQLVW